MSHSAVSAARVQAAERRLEALRLRRDGYTYQQIASALGVSVSRAHDLVTGAYRQLREELSETADDALQLDLSRLDGLLRAHWPRAVGAGAEPPDPKSAEVVLKMIDRRARLLGLDAPTKTEGSLRLSALSDSELIAKARQLDLLGDNTAGLLSDRTEDV